MSGEMAEQDIDDAITYGDDIDEVGICTDCGMDNGACNCGECYCYLSEPCPNCVKQDN